MEEILRPGLASLGIDPPVGAVEQMAAYGRMLLAENEITNLTAIREPDAAARLHFLDSAALLQAAELDGQRVIDVGSGPGFPGVPLRLLCPAMELTVIDSVGKKMDFVRRACDTLGIGHVTCLSARVEERTELRERFDIAVSRAVASLDLLAELCLPLVRVGGRFLAMKGPDCEEEASAAEFAVRTLGGELRSIHRYTIPGTDVTHAAVVIGKVAPTPARYPRRYAQIKKKPLRG